MTQQDLYFNILTFDFPVENPNFYFSERQEKGMVKVHKSLFPENISSIFPAISGLDSDFLYCSFTHKKPNTIPLEIDFNLQNPYLVARFYNKLIFDYFANDLGLIVRRTYINDNQVWIKTQEKPLFDVYEKYTLKIKIKSVSDFPELQISYDGESKVSNLSVPEMIKKVQPHLIIHVLYANKIRKYENLDLDSTEISECFPVISKPLRTALELGNEVNYAKNKYLIYLDKINLFKQTFIADTDIIPGIKFHSLDFLTVSDNLIKGLSHESSLLEFKNDVTNIPKEGIKKLKVYANTPHKRVQLFFVFYDAKEQLECAKSIKKYFDEGLKWFKGLYEYVNLTLHTEGGFSIRYKNLNDPMPELIANLESKDFRADTKYIAIVISPFTKPDSELSKRNYYGIKELLLNKGVTTQFIRSSTVFSTATDFVFSLPNIAVALLAKLNGIPWRLLNPIENELIVGVGAFKHLSTDTMYLGCAFSFNNTGKFNRFEYFSKSNTSLLAGSIITSIQDFKEEVSDPKRLIIHFYKTMSQEELDPILNALESMGLDIPVFIVSITKTEADDIFVYDNNYDQLLPVSGTHIKIGPDKYLLFNNARYQAGMTAGEKYHFPIKLSLKAVPSAALTAEEETQLIDQVYQFSKMYWRSINQQNLPVTVKYPEIIAQIAPNFQDDLPETALDNPWFL